MACFRCSTTEILIFLLKYRQRKVDLNTSKKSLVFVTIRQKILSLTSSYLIRKLHNYAKIRIYGKMLHFRLKESSKNMIFLWNGNIRKLTKIWYFLPFSQIFVRRKFFFSRSVIYLLGLLLALLYLLPM